MVGVGITILVRSRKGMLPPYESAKVLYSKPVSGQKGAAKLQFLLNYRNTDELEWQELKPNEKHNWFTENLRFEYGDFLPMGTREAKSARAIEIGGIEVKTIFKTYSQGAQTNRDNWMYDFNRDRLSTKSKSMTETYNSEVARWMRAGSPKDTDNFVTNDETKIKWSSRLKECFERKMFAEFSSSAIRKSLYRPFTQQFLYFDTIMTHRQGMFSSIFPDTLSEIENSVICVAGVGNRKDFGCIATNIIPSLDLAFEKTQCFPYYIYLDLIRKLLTERCNENR